MLTRATRWLPLAAAALLALLGLACLFAPTRAAATFGLFPDGPAGLGNLRGDLGAFFLGLAGFAIAGAVRADARLLMVPAAFLALVLPGRVVGFALDGRSASGLRSVAVELVLLALLLGGARAVRAPRQAPPPAPARRSRARVVAAVAAVVVLALAGIGVAAQRSIGMTLARKVIAARLARRTLEGLPDGLHAGLCGSGSPLPDADRAGPCVFVVAGERLFLVDAGEGSPRKLALLGIPPARIDGIFLTHFHSDHIGGLGEMLLQRWAGGGRASPLDVFGPQGVEAVVDGFNRAYELDKGYRVAHHGAATMPPGGSGGVARPFAIPPGRDVSVVVLEQDGLRVTAFNVVHTPVFPAVGYRFEYAGRSVVVSGDTAPSSWLAVNARGADVLFHEALQTSMVALLHDGAEHTGNRVLAKVTADIPSYHTTPEDAARLAEEAGVGHLVLYHLIPPLPTSLMDATFLGDAPARFHGPITVGYDGLVVSLARGDRSIALRDLR